MKYMPAESWHSNMQLSLCQIWHGIHYYGCNTYLYVHIARDEAYQTYRPGLSCAHIRLRCRQSRELGIKLHTSFVNEMGQIKSKWYHKMWHNRRNLFYATSNILRHLIHFISQLLSLNRRRNASIYLFVRRQAQTNIYTAPCNEVHHVLFASFV